jgi:hypothetical protein
MERSTIDVLIMMFLPNKPGIQHKAVEEMLEGGSEDTELTASSMMYA